MPRPWSARTKTTLAVVLAVGVVVLFAGGLQLVSARQERLAESARKDTPSAAVAASTLVEKPQLVPPPLPAPAPVTAAPADSSPMAVSPLAPLPSTEAGTAPMPGAPVAAAPSVPTAVGSASPNAVIRRAGSPSAASPANRAVTDENRAAGTSLVSQASEALSLGAASRAVDLARQAVAQNPSDADAWLTLGAAYQASGRASAARDAYRSCVAQGRGRNVSECRVLVGP